MPDTSQILKGLLEGCVLSTVASEETYGYEICRQLAAQGFKGVSEGTVYPILIRLQRKGLLATTKRDSPLGPERKYYHLTGKGADALRDFVIEWKTVRDVVERFVKGVSSNGNRAF